MKKKHFLLVCVLLLAAVLCACGTSTSNDDAQADALSAYQEILKSAPAIEGEHEELMDASFDYEQNLAKFGKHYESFVITDLNQDGTPELIALSTVNFRWTAVDVYSYADGNAVLLKGPMNEESPVTFDQQSTANGAYITYICEENHIHSVWRGTDPAGEAVEENSAYAFDGTALTSTDCAVVESENTAYFSDIAVANTSENSDAITR